MMGTAQLVDASSRRNSQETAVECRTAGSEASRGNPIVKLNGYERAHRCALVAARLAYLFDSNPAVQQARVYLSAHGFVMVRENVGKVPERLLGVYDRSVTPKQPSTYGSVSDRMMRSGQRVRVLRGEHEGRAGVVEALAIDGVAVRLDAAWPRAPFVQVKVIAPGDLVRIQRSRLPSPRRAEGLR